MPKNSVAARGAKSRNEPPTALVEYVRRRGHETKVEANGFSPAAFKLKPAAAYLGGLSVPTMHRLVKDGKLRPFRQVRHLLFTKSELDRWLVAGM